MGQNTNQICFVSGRHHVTGIAVIKLFGIHLQQARIQKVSTDFKFQENMSNILRQRKKFQQSSLHLSRQRIILE